MSAEQRFLNLISGRSRGTGPALARTGLALLSPLYRGVVTARNGCFSAGLKRTHDLGRPTISVGNLTTGGTGKTPVDQWLVKRLREAGERPAILLRGYKAVDGFSDEAELLKETGVPVHADPDRVAGAAAVLQGHPEITAFVLDDGFQHRRAARALDLVLLDAANPFGHGHVLPRGLLREPAENLARANAVLVTRAEADLNWAALCHQIRVLAPAAPVFRCRHICRGLVDAGGCPVPSPGRVLALSGIGNPDAFITSLMDAGIDVGGSHAVADHHVYAASDLVHLKALCDRYDGIVTTEKDWVKLRRLPGVEKLPFYRSQLVIDFADDQAEALFALIEKSVQAARIVKH